MPKEVVDYKKTVMYKIQHLDIPELVYINHTTNFDKRKSYHKKMQILNHAIWSYME